MHFIICIVFYALYSLHYIPCITLFLFFYIHFIICIVLKVLYSMHCIPIKEDIKTLVVKYHRKQWLKLVIFSKSRLILYFAYKYFKWSQNRNTKRRMSLQPLIRSFSNFELRLGLPNQIFAWNNWKWPQNTKSGITQ